MTLINIYESDFGEASVEFKNLLEDLRLNIESYTQAKLDAQKERMLIIGKVEEYRQTFPQRSKEHTALYKAMKAEGWSDDVLYNNRLAYKGYQHLLSLHESHQAKRVLKKATVTHLMLIEQGIDFFELQKYERRHKKLPPVSALRGRLGGFFDETFQPLSRFRTDWSRQPIEQVHEVVVVDEPTNSSEEVIETTQADLRHEFMRVIYLLNFEEAAGDKEFQTHLQGLNEKLERLHDWSKPKRFKPQYV